MGPFSKKMETRHLRDTDMKKLVHIFYSVPQDASDAKKARHCRHTKEDIHYLPRRLRATHFSLHATSLCSTHKGLDDHLIKEIWSWLLHELGGTIGQFLYPVIMCGRLSATEELEARQLEPVSQMWRRDYNQAAATPPSHEPIHRDTRWAYQANKCAACILGRIGSDPDVLFALFAGMVGRFSTRTLVNAEALGSTDAWEKTRSKRIRFVKYWLRTIKDGDAAVFLAGTLGMKMRRVRREWMEEQQRIHYEQQLSLIRPSLNSNSDRTEEKRDSIDQKIGPVPRPADVKRFSPASHLGFNISPSPTHAVQQPALLGPPARQPLPIRQPTTALPIRPPSASSDDTVRLPRSPVRADSTQHLRPAPLQPRPKQAPVCQPRFPTTSPIPEGYAPIWDRSGRANPTESEYAGSVRTVWRPTPYTPSVSTLTHHSNRIDSIISPTPPLTRQSSTRTARPFSLATARTIISYDGAASSWYTQSIADPYSPFFNLPLGYEVHLDALSTLPRPSRGSMYQAFGDGKWNAGRFECVDEEGGEEGWSDEDDGEVADGLERAARMLRPKGSREELGETIWEDLY